MMLNFLQLELLACNNSISTGFVISKFSIIKNVLTSLRLSDSSAQRRLCKDLMQTRAFTASYSYSLKN